jgi:phage-related holin
MSPLLIYLIFNLASFGSLFVALATLLILVFFILADFYLMEQDERNNEKKIKNMKFYKKYAKICLTLFFICALIATLIPDTKTACMMYVIPKITQSEQFKKDVPEIYNLAIESLKNNFKNNLEENEKEGK